ncbi:galactose mutarotase [Tianweitania sp. BSSL-BM11]|uniref:Aldose 1-epimerase n=1 Tax=Tianweitania aestuarii TaxID=2814886 RepID=A0ABS5RTS3_9HYPH|nr:aldose epimerase family protein [Tianweitania aestuarii]MBS9719127.1 galactose mutarotase [Tianweitania aestuarii]
MAGTIERTTFGVLKDGRSVDCIRLAQDGGLDVRIITLGAAVQALFVPDAGGMMADVVLGYDDPEDYRVKRQFFGATIGRFSNRIAGGRFELDGKVIHIATNEGKNVLHGGPEGFDQKLWTIEDLGTEPEPFVRLGLVSPDGDQGFPGEVTATVTYRLTNPGELSMRYEATSDRTTVIGMTHHGYFNLGGVEHLRSVLDHRLQMPADHYLAVASDLIPEESPRSVADTLFDFREAKPIMRDLRTADDQLLTTKGYDHCFCLADKPHQAPRLAARLHHPASGRVMELHSDQPGLQFYSGNMLNAGVAGKYGQIARQGDALCLEPQSWPNAPNRPDFPSARLEAGETYRHQSIYRFSAQAPDLG